jgi:hypothetical protein
VQRFGLLQLSCVGIYPLHWWHVQGAREKINNTIQQGLYTPVFESSATIDGNKLERRGGLSDAGNKHLRGYRGLGKIGLHELIVNLRH